MIGLLTDSYALDSIGAADNIPFDNEILGGLDFSNVPWFYLDSLPIGLRVRTTILDGNSGYRSQKFRNPTVSSYGYIAIQSEGYVVDKYNIDCKDMEKWYYAPAPVILGNYKNRINRYGREISGHNDVAINVQPTKMCGVITTNDANIGASTSAFVDSIIPIGAVKTYSYRGEDTFQEIPPSQIPQPSSLVSTLAEVGLPNSYGGIIFQDITLVVTLDVFFLGLFTGYLQPPVPDRAAGTPQLPSYVHLCDSGIPNPLPTNPPCNPADFGPQLSGTIFNQYGCPESN